MTVKPTLFNRRMMEAITHDLVNPPSKKLDPDVAYAVGRPDAPRPAGLWQRIKKLFHREK